MRRGTSVIEMLVFVAAAALLLVILVAVLGVVKKGSGVMKECADQRGVMVAMGDYGSGNKGWFPGLMPTGGYRSEPFQGISFGAKPNARTVSQETTGAGCSLGKGTSLALAILLEEGRITPAQMVAPDEDGRTSAGIKPIGQVRANPAGDPTVDPEGSGEPPPGEVRGRHVSFASLAYGRATLKPAWKTDRNPQAVLMASRLIFHGRSDRFSSIQTEEGSGRWKGVVVRADESAAVDQFKSGDPEPAFGSLKYGTSAPFSATAESSSVVGIFGRSTDMGNFDAAPNTGQVGSVND